jgi:hypothetical protein
MSNGQSEKEAFVKEFERRLTGEKREIPTDIKEWLGHLLLLYGIPFHYLVPEESMLPQESIRFFYLDPGWMKCLLEGACSVGRSSSVDELFDQHLRNNFLNEASEKAKEVRAGRRGNLEWPLTGFLMRSRVVEGWQGLEMTASGVDRIGNRIDPIEPLRIDRLSPDIMLCLFNGKVTRIEIKQPPEGMHFGASSAGGNVYRKLSLRRLSPADRAGDQIFQEGSDRAIGLPIDVPMRPAVRRVVNMTALAERMKTELNRVKAIDGTDRGRFTSAEFGVEMVESPGRVIFSVDDGKPRLLPHLKR